MSSLQNKAMYEAALKQRFGATHKRYLHSMSVAKTAENLANRFGEEPTKAYVAGVLHDWEKNKTLDEIASDCLDLGIMQHPDDKPWPVLHGYLAARTLPLTFPELTPEILSAIAKHTTADASMSNLDKIIFVADAIEPLRPATPELTELRELASHASLDKLYQEVFKNSLVYVLKKGQVLDPDSVKLYNQLISTHHERAL